MSSIISLGEINAIPFIKFKEVIYTQATLKVYISGSFYVGWYKLSLSPLELKYFAIFFMSVSMPTTLSNKDYGDHQHRIL